jgi:hypothetical protein
MRLIIDDLNDEIFGPYYIDVILSADELQRIGSGEMVSTMLDLNGKRFYVGALKQGRQKNYEEENDWQQDEESFWD